MSSSVLSSAASRVVTVDELDGIVTPEARGATHKPLGHSDFVRAIHAEVKANGYVIGREQIAVSKDDMRLFGVMDLVPDIAIPGSLAARLIDGTVSGMSIGFRHSNDQRLSARMVAGQRVFVCDNLMLTGQSIVLKKKHTLHLDIEHDVQIAFDGVLGQFSTLNVLRGGLTDAALDDKRAREVIYSAFLDAEVIAPQYLPKVHDWYFEKSKSLRPEDVTDIAQRNAWGLYNSFTRVLREFPGHRVQDATIRTTNFFGREFGILAAVGDEAEAVTADF